MTAAAVILFMAASCSYRVERNPFFDEKSAPARPCVLMSDTTLLVVRDYFPGIGRVDGLTCNDYTVVPLSPDSMDTVLVVAGPASRNISTVRVTTGEESGVIVLKREPPKAQTVPSVTVVGTDMGGREFTVKVDNTPASYLVQCGGDGSLLHPHLLAQCGGSRQRYHGAGAKGTSDALRCY